MGGLVFIFIAFILVVVLILVIILWGHSQKKDYGPQELLDGPSFCSGSLTCRSWKAPTPGKQLVFEYSVKVTANNKDITGFYRYPADESEDEIYGGQIFITKENSNLVGRTNRKYFEGTFSPNQANLQTMYRAAKIFRTPFRFELINGQVNFINTKNSQTIVDHNSQLTVAPECIRGRILHTRESWVVTADIQFHSMAAELMTLIVLIISNDILDFHHDQ